MKKDETRQRGMRDEAGVGPEPRAAMDLTPLRELKHVQVADGEPDIRGWDVYTATGRELGEVEDLLVDVDRGEVVMLDIDLKRDDRHTMAPVKAAWIDRQHRRVVLNTSHLDVDDAIPAYRRGAATADEDRSRFSERYARAYGDEGWHEGRDFVVRRPGDEMRVSRTAPPPSELSGQPMSVDRPVSKPADRDGDRVPDAIERRASATGSGSVRFPPNRDEVVVERRPVVMEEVVVRRRVVDPNDPDAASLNAGQTRLPDHPSPEHRPPTDERR